MLNVPYVPSIPGASRFRGRAFHSSRWDHSKSIEGERVASIGTGSECHSYVPAIAPSAEQVTVSNDADLDHATARPWRIPPGAAAVRARAVRGAAASLADLVDVQKANFDASSEQTLMQTRSRRPTSNGRSRMRTASDP